MTALMDMDMPALEELMAHMGEARFRARQIHEGFVRGKALKDMTNLPAGLISRLLNEHAQGGARVAQELCSPKDGTVKYLFELDDGEYVEGVLLPYAHGNTLCLSTQVGCAMGCVFCASGQGGLVRNLTPGEMLAQAYLANARHAAPGKRGVTNLVLMGSGEPLQNYKNVLQFLRRVSAAEGLNISPRNISLSTCGIPQGIRALMGEGMAITLCISLHSAFDDERSAIMPVNRAYPLGEVVEAAREYALKTGRRVIFEYALIRGRNDAMTDARGLKKLLGGFPAHINVIPLNSAPGSALQGAGGREADKFVEYLVGLGLSATRRRTMGDDIEGACGQLRRRRQSERAGIINTEEKG